MTTGHGNMTCGIFLILQKCDCRAICDSNLIAISHFFLLFFLIFELDCIGSHSLSLHRNHVKIVQNILIMKYIIKGFEMVILGEQSL